MSPFCPFALSADFLLTTAEAQVSKHVFSTVKEVLWITPFVFWITASRSTALYSHHILKKGLFMGPLDFKTWRFYQFRIGVITCSRSWWVRFSTLIGLFLFFKLIFSRIKKNIYIYILRKSIAFSVSALYLPYFARQIVDSETIPFPLWWNRPTQPSAHSNKGWGRDYHREDCPGSMAN